MGARCDARGTPSSPYRDRKEGRVGAAHPKEFPGPDSERVKRCVYCMCSCCLSLLCVTGESKHLRDPSPTQIKRLIYVLMHVAGVCDEASLNVFCVCVCWCVGVMRTMPPGPSPLVN